MYEASVSFGCKRARHCSGGPSFFVLTEVRHRSRIECPLALPGDVVELYRRNLLDLWGCMSPGVLVCGLL